MNFIEGHCYIATSTLDSRRKALVVAAGRDGRTLTFVRGSAIGRAEVRTCDCKEVAVIGLDDGEYSTSTSVEVDAVGASAVLSALGGK